MRTSITPDSPRDDGPDKQCQAHDEGQYREKEKITMGLQQRNISMQALVYRQSLDLSAAYLHPEMRTSITPDSPHDDGPDEQCQAHVQGQCREKVKRKHDIVEHHSDRARRCLQAESRP